ncbi:MAG: hypothetical protein ACRELB_03320 [Polyangiaceae bacterium]
MNRVLLFWSIVVTLVVASASAGANGERASSSGMSGAACISESAKNTLTVCPGGPQLHPAQGKQPQMSFHSKVEELKKGTKTIGVGTADVAMLAGIRDQRQTALKQRVLALLITEIQQLE